MKRNFFGDAQPSNSNEIFEALDEKAYDGSCVYAIIVEPDEDNIGTEWEGWCAEVYENEEGEEVFSTLGFVTREELVSALKGAGINDIQNR